MAIVNFYDDLFSEKSAEIKCKKNQKLRNVINRYFENKKDLICVDYEVYDVETGETSYIKEFPEDIKTCVLVNGEEKNLDYIIKAEDIINVIVIPLKADMNQGTNIFATIAGFVLGGIGTAFIFVGGAPMILAGVGCILAGAATHLMTAAGMFNLPDAPKSLSNNDAESLIQKEQKLSISGGGNSDIIGNRFPIVLGKHLVNPYVIGSPFNTTVVKNKEGDEAGQYLTQMYCVGHSPLKLTELKLGDIILSHNSQWGENDAKNILHGKLKWSKDKSENDSGEILNKWKNNDIEVEILQAGGQSEDEKDLYGTLYPGVVEQLSTNSNILNLKDGIIDELSTSIYNGVSVPTNYQSNSVKLSHSCPLRIEVDLDFVNGLYATRTFTTSGSGTVMGQSLSANETVNYYYDLPVRLAVQWRYYNKNNPSSDPTSPAGWHDFDKIEFRDTIDGNVKTTETMYPEKCSRIRKMFEYNSSLGLAAPYEIDNDDWIRNSGKTFNFGCEAEDLIAKGYAETEKKASSGTYIENYILYYYELWEKDDSGYYKWVEHSTEDRDALALVIYVAHVNGSYDRTIRWRNKIENKTRIVSTAEKELTEEIYLKSVNNYGIQDYPMSAAFVVATGDKNTRISERRYTAVKEFNIEEIKKIINADNSYDSSMDCVEVRVVRITPCYLNQEGKHSSMTVQGLTISGNAGNMQYYDLVKWTNLRTVVFDKEKIIKAINNKESITDLYKYRQRLYSEEFAKKFTFVALRIKQDVTQTGGSSLNKFSCIAEAITPKYNAAEDCWYPKKIEEEFSYFKLLVDNNGNKNFVSITEEEYEQNKDSSAYKKVKKGNNFVKLVKSDLFNDNTKLTSKTNEPHKWYLSKENEEKYINANSACQFALAMVGPYLKEYSKTYNDINMQHLTEFYKFCEMFNDGQRDSKTNRLIYMKMCCNGVISNEIKFETLLTNILLTGRASLIRDINGRYDMLIGREVDYPVDVLGNKNIISINSTRSFANDISGYLVNYTDETDNYNSNSFYVMADGEDSKAPTNEIQSFNLKFVTNPYQYYSLARYNLGLANYQREIYRIIVGEVGYTYSFGDVVLLQHNSLLVGTDKGGVIKELILSNDGKILKGFVIDDAIEWTGEEGRGVTIVQPEKFSASRCVTLELASLNERPADQRGLTNKIYLKYPVNLTEEETTDGNAVDVEVHPRVGNLVAFGKLTQITEPVQIMGIKPKENHQFELNCVPYNSQLFNSGAKIPEFTANTTKPNYEEINADFNINATLQDLNNKIVSNNAITMANVRNSMDELTQSGFIQIFKRSEQKPTEDELPKSYLFYNFSTSECYWCDEDGNKISADSPSINGWSFDFPEQPVELPVYMTIVKPLGKGTQKTVIINSDDFPAPIVYLKDGRSVTNVEEYYKLTSKDDALGIPGGNNTYITDELLSESGWKKTDYGELSAYNKYLWNLEVTYYSDGSIFITNPVIIGVYSSGRGVKTVHNYYIVSDITDSSKLELPVLTESHELSSESIIYGWTTEPQKTTDEKKVLWNCESIEYNDDTWGDVTPARAIGTQGPQGISGYNTATVTLYKRTQFKPAKADLVTGDSYYFFNGSQPGFYGIKDNLNGWTEEIPAENGYACYAISATVLCIAEGAIIKATIDKGDWSAPQKILSSNATPTVYFDVSHAGIPVSDTGYTMSALTIKTTVHVVQANEELVFAFELDKIKEHLPNGFTVLVDEHTLIINIKEGSKVTSGNIPVYILYQPYLTWAYMDGTKVYAETDNGKIYSTIQKSGTGNTYTLGFSYNGVNGGVYYNGISSKEEYDAAIRKYGVVSDGDYSIDGKSPNIGDYFTWTGDNVVINVSETKTETFRTGKIYVFTGKSWIVDESENHSLMAITDILSLNDIKMEEVNEHTYKLCEKLASNKMYKKLSAEEFVADDIYAKAITADEVFCNTFATASLFTDSLAANDAFVEKLVANNILAKKIIVKTNQVTKAVNTIYYQRLESTDIPNPQEQEDTPVDQIKNPTISDDPAPDKWCYRLPDYNETTRDCDYYVSTETIFTYYINGEPKNSFIYSKPDRADYIKKTLDEALSAATSASEANTAAEAAKTAADGAKTAASASILTANSAKSSADNAKKTANDAKTTADDAKKTANDAANSVIKSSRTVYYLGGNTQPSKPTSKITESNDVAGKWTSVLPSYYTYYQLLANKASASEKDAWNKKAEDRRNFTVYYTCEELTLNDGSVRFTSVINNTNVLKTIAQQQGEVIIEGGYLSANLIETDSLFARDIKVGFKDSVGTTHSGSISSMDWNENSKDSGWKLYSNGDVYFNNGTFRGEIYATSGSFTGEINATSGSFKGKITGATITGSSINCNNKFEVSENGIVHMYTSYLRGATIIENGLVTKNRITGKYTTLTSFFDAITENLSKYTIYGKNHFIKASGTFLFDGINIDVHAITFLQSNDWINDMVIYGAHFGVSGFIFKHTMYTVHLFVKRGPATVDSYIRYYNTDDCYATTSDMTTVSGENQTIYCSLIY